MSLRKLSVLISFASAGLFSLFLFLPFFSKGDNLIYDLFLRLRPRRQTIDNVIFLDVDDAAVANIGVFPWPRSIIANGLLRLREHGAKLAIFDIEFINKSPTQVDELYLKEGLVKDYNRHFSEIGTTVAQVLGAVASGRIPHDRIPSYVDGVSDLIAGERDALYTATLQLASDDDRMLANGAALFGRTWGTLNLQNVPLSGEQAQRRTFAEGRFSYPIINEGGIAEGKNVDILPAIPLFAQAVKGAGFTNIDPDADGVRRRIFLTQEVQGHWYLQLAFAPLMNSWGNPAIRVYPRRMVIEGGDRKVTIPLDKNGTMLLDWPRENYEDSYKHISFADFSTLDDYLAHIEEYLSALEFSNSTMFPYITRNAPALLEYYRLQREAKRRALDECSGEALDEYLRLRDEGLNQTREYLDYISSENYIDNVINKIISNIDNNDVADGIRDEAEYCRTLLGYIDTELNAFLSLNQKVHERLNDRFCIIGRTDTGTTDIAVNPFHAKYINVGTHAVVLDTILTESFITPLSVLFSILFSMLFVPLVLVFTSGIKPSIRSLLGFLGVALSFVLPLFLFIFFRIYLASLGTILAMTVAVIVRELVAFVTSEQEKRFIRRAFSTYLSAGVVAELIADPSKLNLGGEKREMTVLFTDIAGFSSISENIDPTQLVRILNRYLTVMSNIIMDNQGTIDKYEGDAIIAFFGAPLHRPDHAALACRSALAMKKAEKSLNEELIAEGLSPSPLFTRVGINTGDMVVGNMGTDNKMDYTVMGNAVNLASRLEGVNKQYQTGIMASEFTKKQAGDIFLSRQLDYVRVVGIHTPVHLYELIGLTEEADKDSLLYMQTWEKAINLFEQRQFNEAVDLFVSLASLRPNDTVAALYVKRCIAFIKDPPTPDWDGVFKIEEK